MTGATGIALALSKQSLDIDIADEYKINWDADYLYFSVREPWPSTISSAEITFGKVTEKAPLILVSQMPENGVIFSDGIEADFLKFNAGTEAKISIARKKGHLIS